MLQNATEREIIEMVIEDEMVRLVTLGDQDTYISQLIDENNKSQGILFSGKPPTRENGKINYNGDEVIIVPTNFKGILSYFKAGFDYLKTYNLKSNNIELTELCKELDDYLNAR